MTAAIAVELAPADAASPLSQALLDACSVGTQTRARCVLSQSTGAVDQRVAIAIVTWDGPARVGARLALALLPGARQKWHARELLFSAADPEVERWRTVGFAIATLVGDLIQHDSDESNAGPTPGARSSFEPTEVSLPASSRDSPPGSWLDGLFSIGTGAASSPSFGGELHFSRMLGAEPWFLAGAAQCAIQSLDQDRLSIVRPAASVGIGVVVLRLARRLHLTLQMEAMLELVQVTGTDAATGVSGEGGRWLPGLKQGVEGAWMWSSNLGLVAAVQATEVTENTDIRAHGQFVARLPAIDLMGQGGVRLAFP
jgi:hypothetical protein